MRRVRNPSFRRRTLIKSQFTSTPNAERRPAAYWQFCAMLLMLAIAAFANQIISGRRSVAMTLAQPSDVINIVSAPEIEEIPIDTTEMSRRINEVIAANPNLQIGVSFVNLNPGTKQQFGVPEAYDAASTAKLLSAIAFLDRVESGSAQLSTPINGLPANEQLKLLITESDNAAWRGINGYLGHDHLLTYAQTIGLQNYNPTINLLTTDDVALLLQKFYLRKLLTVEHTDLLLSYMQKANRNDYIVSFVPPEARVYHKAGWLNDRAHDAAIIDNGKNPYVLVIFTKSKGKYNPEVGKKVFQQITTATVETMFR